MKLLDLMEPEETVGNLWHDMASGIGAGVTYPDAAVTLASVRPSLAVLFRALGGTAGVELGEVAQTLVHHRQVLMRKLGTARDREWVARFDGEKLMLPPVMDIFPEQVLNRTAYFWLTALAAHTNMSDLDLPKDGPVRDWAHVQANAVASEKVLGSCPGLRNSYSDMAAYCAQKRTTLGSAPQEAAVEQAIRDQLGGTAPKLLADLLPAKGYMPCQPVPIWLRFERPGQGSTATEGAEADAAAPPPTAALSNRKLAERKDQDQHGRKDSFIIHRFESILSWVESMNINRSIDDDDEENAQKAADDQDRITLSKQDHKVATRLRLHLDLSPADADHEALAGKHTYPEWNHRSRSYLDNHCRVLDAPAQPGNTVFSPNEKYVREVRRQFEALSPRRILQPRQIDGQELDLDAVLTARADMIATGSGSDRIWQAARQMDRDVSVAFLIDTSRSTEAAIGDTSVIDLARDTMAALAVGIDAAGDRLGIWGFSSLRRDRVFLTRCKDFETPMSPQVTANIGALKPGHYTRLGTAIRHVSAQLAKEPSSRKLLIVLTDGKPNDLDHYEGQHGIEDSHMAVREARAAQHSLHGIVIDEDGEDWFARIFGRGGFTLLPNPERLSRALPDIYRTLTQET
ncbi:VWA domain-containing protein [Sulfitobacter sp. M57]|uniref:nitric oxide reductase activation protein NorD n=1 Tax=unclassified Sulfitobacter TaxID=196795 RepID=UPI0023E1D259|nr:MULTISPECIES: VWA domain-containing protein [unclassified Sulfitobacter]MDF3416626.1 VWA domain-containing protein [Sulfitobacter sp. KE5]MDF3424106.1 VWA domain-containing protein [Sulfitobacter sp. KE43]MDF3435171.1 VWA domain-containing protein [Sulfitobacter sp. KE42]MDF3460825.1 VWA domain-containing protein [Sulfitobacter sp. S74]MDF3464708.1 VWA domain-containing protein [Sulfitobacter sp. Ks18]